jgi:hypothetical protein
MNVSLPITAALKPYALNPKNPTPCFGVCRWQSALFLNTLQTLSPDCEKGITCFGERRWR